MYFQTKTHNAIGIFIIDRDQSILPPVRQYCSLRTDTLSVIAVQLVKRY